jgi:uncharacterized protein YcbK (DUF882 family)
MARSRVLLAMAMGASVAFVSWPEPRVAAARTQHEPHAFAPTAREPADDARELTRAFEVRAINTDERVTVRLVRGEPDAASMASLRHLLRCHRTQRERDPDPRLVKVLARVAERTGKPVEVVSAYRAPEHARDENFHTRGMAADIRVPDVSTRELLALAKELGVPGRGYYPASKMIHVDVRDVPYSWTDWSGPSKRR